MQQFSSTAKSSTLSCFLFKNLKLAQVSSTEKMICPFVMIYIKWATSKVQYQFSLITFSPKSLSLTQFYNAYPKLRACAFIVSMIDADKKYPCSLETSKTKSCQPYIKKSLHKTSHFSLTYLCT